MGKIVYDFRDGLEPEKLIFKENTHKCKESTYWILYLLLDWIYACGWYALFHWAYINYEDISFWVLGISWIVFVLAFIINSIINLKINSNAKKERKLKELEEQEKMNVHIKNQTEHNFEEPRTDRNKIEQERLKSNEQNI